MLVKKLRESIKSLAQQGLSPRELSLGLAVGTVLAVFPVFGVTSLLCILAAAKLKLNQLATQVANYCAYPLQFLLFIPFIRLGEWLFGLEAIPVQPGRAFALARHDFDLFLSSYGSSLATACLAWLLLALPAVWVLSRSYYMVATRVIPLLAKRQ